MLRTPTSATVSWLGWNCYVARTVDLRRWRSGQPYLCGLCDILGVATPEPTRETGYAFDYDAIEHHPEGFTTKGLAFWPTSKPSCL